MAEIHVMAERSISAPAADVYRYLADYQDHHPHFLPPAFSGVAVESGGVGAGTVLRFGLRLGGRTRAYRQAVTEPEPGRVLRETGLVTGEVTTFTVAPQGVACRVRIETRFGSARGVQGLVERLAAPRLLRRLYRDELERLDRYAQEQAAPPAALPAR